MGTVMERSHIALHKWLTAFYLMASSKKGISAHQLHRTLGIDYKSAWFMTHRIREAMRTGGGLTPMGGEGKIVEADETYLRPSRKAACFPKRSGPFKQAHRSPRNKRSIVALVERGGSVRTFHVAVADKLSVADDDPAGTESALVNGLRLDTLTDSRRFRILVVVDDFTRECLCLVADTSLSGMRVGRELDALIAERGRPASVVSDNGTELTSMAILRWSQETHIEWHYIAPGKPTQNAFVESFNGRLQR